MLDSLHLPLVHFDALFAEDVAKESDGGFVEFTLLKLEPELVFSQLLQDLCNEVEMVEEVTVDKVPCRSGVARALAET